MESNVLKGDPLGGSPGQPSQGKTLRVGVEEEFLLHDLKTGRLAPRAPELIELLSNASFSARSEMQSTQIEISTEPADTLASVRSGLLQGRKRVADAARELGLSLLPAGMPPHETPLRTPVDDPRYQKMFKRYGAAAERYQGCGAHVHVEIPDRDTGVAVLGHVRPWLPLLAAIGGNSAFCSGGDTRFSSWRMITQRRFPVSGLPPLCERADQYDAAVTTLVEAGLLEDHHTCFWLARLSDRYPTIEFRTSDVGITADDSALQAALSRALVITALREIDSGVMPPEIEPQWADAAVWSAARYGLDGPLIDPVRREPFPASTLLAMLLDKTTDALCAAGDYYDVRTMLSALKKRGTGAQLQRRAETVTGVVTMLTAAGCHAEGLGRGATHLLPATDDWRASDMPENENNPKPEPTPPAEDQTNLVHEEPAQKSGMQPKAAGTGVVILTALLAIAFLIVAVYLGGSLLGAW